MQKKSLVEFARKCENIYCYGIGTWGTLISKYCNKYNVTIIGYIISTREEACKIFNGKRVFSVKEIKLNNNDGIIIATTQNHFIEEMVTAISNDVAADKIYCLTNHNDIVNEFEKKYKKIIKSRKKKSIFDYIALAQPINFYQISSWDMNNIYYGIDKCVRKYNKLVNYNIKLCTIDHGMRLAKLYKELELNPIDKNVYTMGDFVWRNIPNINLHQMGPYIQYVKSLLSYGKLKRIKKKLGKTLLVFPSHGIFQCGVTYDYNDFIDEIEYIKKQYGYQTVMVCMFCADVIKKQHVLYKRMGYKIVTAGYTIDSNFLNRLRTFFLLSDMVITNKVGTHIGYSICLNRPVYIYIMNVYDDNDLQEIVSEEKYEGDFKNEFEKANCREMEIEHYFKEYKETISEEQYDVVRKYWGSWNRKRNVREI